ncbi:MAG: FeoA family protein [Microcoleaceae cyanobacterium MO_207.B10]|nr:FeoA family protein [Microcoleaceae cyanobacterium MO_207.B10]
MNLSNLKPGQIAIVDRIVNKKHEQALSQRLEAMGIVSNRPVQILQEAKSGGPLQIRVGATTEIAIRPYEAEMILIKTDVLSEDAEVSSNHVPNLSKQVKTASFVSISAVILVAIAGFYRILISRNILYPAAADEKVLVGNLDEKSQGKMILEETSKNVPSVTTNADSVNKKSDPQEQTSTANQPEKTPSQTNQNSTISPEVETSYNPQNIESKSQKITDEILLIELEQKLYNTIDQNWQIPLNKTSIYIVKVDKNGAIASYEPLNQVAADNLNNTPLPSLVNSEAKSTELPETDWAEFTILMYDNGALEVQPK